MASAKPASTTRRASPNRGSGKKGEQEVSPARWAGVAFVITAIVAAIILGMLSPSDPDATPAVAAVVESPAPSAGALDSQVPIAQPTIMLPKDGEEYPEFVIPVTVELPRDEIPGEFLQLHIMRGDESLKTKENPKIPGTVTVKGVEVDEGANELTAVLTGPGGWGPRSDPVVVIVDRDAPGLEIITPENKAEVYDKVVRVEGTSEIEAEVKVRNETTGKTHPYGVIGADGEFSVSVPLKPGANNKLRVVSTGAAGIPQSKTIRVIQVDGRPKVKIRKIEPNPVSLSSLPAQISIRVDVTDAKGKPMPEAEVFLSLGGPGQEAEQDRLVTNAKGRVVWKPTIEAGSERTDTLSVVAEATSPLSDKKRRDQAEVTFR
jgi:hypothetical protein